MDMVYKPAERRRNHIVLNLSDNELALVNEDIKERGMIKSDYLRAAIETYSGKKIFRESYPNGARIIYMKQQSAKETSQ